MNEQSKQTKTLHPERAIQEKNSHWHANSVSCIFIRWLDNLIMWLEYLRIGRDHA